VTTYNYNQLWKLLIDKGLNRTELKRLAGISTNAVAKMGGNKAVAMETLAKVCAALQCGVDDIVEMKTDDNGGNDRGRR